MPRLAVVLLVVPLAAGCGSNPAAPGMDTLAITATLPAPGTTIVVPEQYPYIVPGGVVLPPGSGLVATRVSMASAHQVPWAQLNVYLLTGGTTTEYCGQNTPDAPTWQFLTPGWATTVEVTGFRVYRLPCEVTGFRAMLHMRNTGLLTPPGPTETVAEAVFPVRFQLRR
ncbi:MAG TPA: hypothetical protein VMR21_17625 [Vicinamibacteria bacterium]|nr:hypothetical protein [Vicinamibacteria bacterium]